MVHLNDGDGDAEEHDGAEDKDEVPNAAVGFKEDQLNEFQSRRVGGRESTDSRVCARRSWSAKCTGSFLEELAAHLYRQGIREKTEEPPKRDGRQFNAQIFQMSRDVGV